MLVYDSIKPDLLYKMSGEMKREYSIYVEDRFAAAIVQQIAISLGMKRYISIITYGSIENAFVVAAGKVLSEENTENVLIVTDGDRFVVEQMGIGKQIYCTIMDIVSEHELWESYISSVYEWIKGKKDEIKLVSIDE